MNECQSGYCFVQCRLHIDQLLYIWKSMWTTFTKRRKMEFFKTLCAIPCNSLIYAIFYPPNPKAYESPCSLDDMAHDFILGHNRCPPHVSQIHVNVSTFRIMIPSSIAQWECKFTCSYVMITSLQTSVAYPLTSIYLHGNVFKS